MSLVEVDNLVVSFGPRPSVDGVSFAIEKGQRFGLIGESGSGKTLTALAMTGLLPSTAQVAGSVRYDGRELPNDEPGLARLRGGRIGMVFQEPMTALNPLMRVGDQIGEAVQLHRQGENIERAVGDLLAEVGLDNAHARRFPHQISGGQRQRVMIAMALAGGPDLMICDEPTSALDLITQRLILDLIDRVCADHGMAVLFISHDLKAVAHLCSDVTVFKAGRQIESGPVSKLFTVPNTGYVRALVAATRTDIVPARELHSAAPLFSARHLTRRFRPFGVPVLTRRKPIIAVDDVSFEIGAGEAVALVGPSGCGKTSLARLVVGLDRPNAGEMTLGDHSYGSARRLPARIRRDVSLVFQDPFGSFDPRLSVGQSVGEPLRLLTQLTGQQKRERLIEAVRAVGLDPEMLERFPHEFSGGQRQRLSIARALVTRPGLVVLDEPVSALDMSIRGEVLTLFNQLRDEFGLAYLIISHDLDMVSAVADRVMVMEAGRIVETGRPEALFAAPAHRLTRDLLAARLEMPALDRPA